jgi:hypothetical protein
LIAGHVDLSQLVVPDRELMQYGSGHMANRRADRRLTQSRLDQAAVLISAFK